MRHVFLLSATLLLAACASERWPGQANDDASAYDYPVVQQRWDVASKKALGTSQDIAEIKQAILKAHPEMKVGEIRWISATEVIVYTNRGKELPLGYESFYCAVEKKDRKWQFIASYLDLIS